MPDHEGSPLLKPSGDGASIDARVLRAHLEHFCPGGSGVPVTGSGPIGLGLADSAPAGADGNSRRYAGQRCGRCGQQIRAGQDARRRIGGTWVHESCRGDPGI